MSRRPLFWRLVKKTGGDRFRPNSFIRFVAISIIGCSLIASTQTRAAPQSTAAVVPQLVSFSGNATDAQAKPTAGIAGVAFAIYNAQYDGVPLWNETQNVTAYAKGNYTVQWTFRAWQPFSPGQGGSWPSSSA
ncbi:MAG: hypothetical protein ABSA29_20760 [Terriglobales bacterium]